ncbi:MAG: hypothetical protein AAGJ79_14560 [Verrucomicrobiota bacterium]
MLGDATTVDLDLIPGLNASCQVSANLAIEFHLALFDQAFNASTGAETGLREKSVQTDAFG